MTGRAATTQGVLAAAALCAAYFTWQREPELAAGEVFALDVSKGDLEKVRFEDEDLKSFSELIRDKDQAGDFVSLRLSGTDMSGVQMPSGHPYVPLKVPERLVRGNETAGKLFERFAPLKATRALGALDPAKLKDLGLDTTKKKIEIVARGAKRRYAIAPAPPGGTDPYIRDEGDGRVYVVARQIMSDLQSASTNLVERKLHSFRHEDIDKVVITAGGKTKEFRGTRLENAAGIRLAPANAPDKPDETVKNWHDRIWNLFPSEVLGKGEEPKEGPPKTAVRIEYSARGRSLGWIELGKSTPPKPAESTTQAPSPEGAYGKSEFTAGWMKLPAEAFSLMTEGETIASRP